MSKIKILLISAFLALFTVATCLAFAYLVNGYADAVKEALDPICTSCGKSE